MRVTQYTIYSFSNEKEFLLCCENRRNILSGKQSWFDGINRIQILSMIVMIMQSRCWSWQRFSSRQVCFVVLLDQHNRTVVTENKWAPQKCGKLSQHTKLFSPHNGKPRRPRTAWADAGTSGAPDCSVFVFDFITARPHSKQTSPSNQIVIDGLAPKSAFAVVYTFPRCRLRKKIIPVILFPPIPPSNHPSLPLLPLSRLFPAPFVRLG